MHEPFDVFEFAAFVRRRWRVIAAACGIALVLSIGASLLLTKRYTATASLVIEPPGGSDVRTATAVSPVYLESLRTYERFAASDTLFARAVEHFHLQEKVDPQPIDSLKRRVLKVSKLRDTKILEISATLADPKLAQQFVEYLANQTVTLSRNENSAADRELIDDAARQLSEAQTRLANSRSAWTGSAVGDSTAALQSNMDAATDVVARIRREMVTEETDVAEYKERVASDAADRASDAQRLKQSQARAAALQSRLTEVEKGMGQDSASLAQRSAHRQALEMELNAAQSAYDSAFEHVRELRANAGGRGERLRVIDPGIVPQRPVSPNLPLNVLSAVLFAFLASMLYLTLAFAFYSRSRLRPSDFTERHAFTR